MRFTNALVTATLCSLAAAHPGHSVAEELQERRAFMAKSKVRDLSHCAAKIKARGLESKNIARREKQVEAARAKRGLKAKRTLDDVIATDHNATGLGYTASTDASTLFSSNASCVLTPDVTQGPYYVGGEYIRENIVETQEGIDTVIDYQVLDVDTCEPVSNVYLEMWHCNSTGVYSGVVADGNGDSSDTTNLDKTFLRGIQETDDDGVATFETIFPGHYTSRATHIHILIHTNVTVYANGTLGNDVTASHVGQGFFDQDLIYEADTVSPYSENTQTITTNADDSILSEETETDGVDPIFEYTYLGDSISDGLFAWLSFGIDTSESSSVNPAVFYYATGGVENSNSGSGSSSSGSSSSDSSSSGSSSGSAPSGSSAPGGNSAPGNSAAGNSAAGNSAAGAPPS